MSAPYVDNLVTDQTTALLEGEAAKQVEFLKTNPDDAAIADSRQAMRDRLASQLDAGTLVQFDVLLATIDLWNAKPLGATDSASWTATEDVLLTMGFLDKKIDLTGAFTNDFVPSMNGGA